MLKVLEKLFREQTQEDWELAEDLSTLTVAELKERSAEYKEKSKMFMQAALRLHPGSERQASMAMHILAKAHECDALIAEKANTVTEIVTE